MGLCKRLAQADDVDVEKMVRTCIQLYVSEEVAHDYLDPLNDLDTFHRPGLPPKTMFALGVAMLFCPVLADIGASHQLFLDAIESEADFEHQLDELVEQKKAEKRNLYAVLLGGLGDFARKDIAGLMQERSFDRGTVNEVRTCCISFLDALVNERDGVTGDQSIESAMFAFMAQVKALKVDHKADDVMVDLLCRMEAMVLAHQANLRSIWPDLDDIKQWKAHEKQVHFWVEKLENVLKALQAKLPPNQADLTLVEKTSEKLLQILSTPTLHLEDTKTQLEAFLNDMEKVDLYKPWKDCKTFSEMATYIMHALEFAVRWLLECVHICSASNRDNYFVQGRKKEIFGAFNTAIEDLKAVDAGLTEEIEQEASFSM